MKADDADEARKTDRTGSRPFILDVIDNRTPTRALVVEDALHCGSCTPRPDPVELPELDP